MKTAKLVALVGLAILAGLILKSDRGNGQGGQQTPVIVKQIVLQHQTTAPEAITLAVPTSSSLYRITLYVNVTPDSNTGVVCPAVVWTDEAGQTSQPFALGGTQTNCAGTGGEGGGSIIAHSIPNSPIVLEPGVEGNLVNGYFDMLVTVEQL